MAFLPEQRFGVLVFSLADAGGNLFGTSIIQQAIDFWTDDPAADRRASERLSTFATEAAKAIREADAIPTVPADRSRGAKPEHVGWYDSAGRGRVAVSLHPDGLAITAGALHLLLASTGNDKFDAYDAMVVGPPLPLVFHRNGAGDVDSFVFREVTFVKEKIDGTPSR